MPADQRIGSQAPLWQLGSPTLALRFLPVALVPFAGSVVLTFGDGGGFPIAAWIFGIFAGIMLLSAAGGYVVLRRMSAKIRAYAVGEGFGFTVRARERTGSWRIAPNSDGAMSRDVVTGTVAGGALTSFLHQSYVGVRKNSAKASARWVGHIVAVRVTVLDVGPELPSVELTPHRLPQVERRTLPTDASVVVGVPEIESAYHVATDDPAFAAELLSAPVVAALRDAPRIAVRVSGS